MKGTRRGLTVAARPRAGRPRLRDEARALFRDSVLSAAEEVFAEHGYQGARMQDIAERARMAVGTVYNHFDQKSDVLVALLELRSDELRHAFAQRPEDPAGFEPRLRARWVRFVDHVERHRGFFRLCFELGLVGSAPVSAVMPRGMAARKARFAAMIEAPLREGVAAGSIRGDPRWLSRFFLGAFRAVIENALLDGKENLQAEASAVIDLFLRGTRP